MENTADEIEDSRLQTQKALLDLYAVMTDLPIGWYEKAEESEGGVREVLSDRSLERFEPYCKAIQRLPGGAELCRQDEGRRAAECIQGQSEGITLCHAGLFNIAAPIQVNGKIAGALMFGQVQLESDAQLKQSLDRHEGAMHLLHVGPAEAAELRRLLLSAKHLSNERFLQLRSTLPAVERWFCAVLEEESKIKRDMFTIVHDVQTRLQAVLAEAENLVNEYEIPTEAKKQARKVLDSALALDSVIQTMGYVGAFRFTQAPLPPLISEAVRIYESEARSKGIEILVYNPRSERQSVTMSKLQLQITFNNLIHNAIKYSFRGTATRTRRVEIKVDYHATECCVSITNYGIGILPEEIHQGLLFRNGYQGKLRESEYRTGAGQGLFFVRRIVDAHHGRIDVESRLKSDAAEPVGQPHLNTFRVYLPYRQPDEVS